MNHVIRFLWSVRQATRRPAVSAWDTTRLPFRVRLRDLDLLRHMTNSAYLSVLDLARVDLVVRSGAWAQQRQAGISAVVASQTITYRKSLKWRDRFEVETRLAGVDDKAAYFEHRFVVNGEIYAQALARMRFLRAGAGAVPISEIMAMVDAAPDDRVPAAWMKDWAAGTALPSTREPAPSYW